MLLGKRKTNINFIETLSHLSCCVFMKDTLGNYIFVNDAVCHVFGLERQAILGKSDEHFFNLKLSLDIRKNDQIVLQGEAVTKIEKNVLKNGVVKYYQNIKSPVYADNGHIVGLIGMAIDISNSIEKHNEFEYAALHDMVTGFYNRRFMEAQLVAQVALHKRKNQPLSFIMIDIDNFKDINDHYGHEVGDRALATVSQLINETVREEDVCCRFGGDEFSILLPFTDQRAAFLLAERIRTSVCNHTFFNNKKEPSHLTITLGVACLSADMQIKTLKKHADDALLKAKKQNKNTTLINCSYKAKILSCYNTECATSTCPAYANEVLWLSDFDH